ncbi:hypothetical protein TSACC_2646 [Terrimicrobium sacchariphilum]|uniref:Uncharacterized protein n=1 Tax=Terrimicrobium sacchariphilum TaxID=690879 RepID=A0A146G616_TERSA|nr:hypothetical protein [Terrimicrobium sacchariphilum]GAT32248.1 hypothetical protein TSACC_2646 [Terrimicrobium sacchariphilum]
MAAILGLPGAYAGGLTLDRELKFSSDELSSGTATKPLAIYSAEPTAPDTLAWDAMGVSLLYGNRLCMTDAGSTDSWVIWKVALPPGYSAKKVTLGLAQIILDGAKSGEGDDKVAVSFSLDGQTWTPIEEIENLGTRTDAKIISKFVCEKEIDGAGVEEFYLRIGHAEGTDIQSDSGYWAVLTSTDPQGGPSPDSFISVVVNH